MKAGVVRKEERNNTSMIKIGPVGDRSAKSWDEKGRSEIVQIFVSYDESINSIQFQYFEDDSLVLSDRYGQIGGRKFDVVRFNYPAEYLTCVSGYKGYSYLASIKFTTNLGSYGPFGDADNATDIKEFHFQLGQDRQFAGFCGTADMYGVRSIGVYFNPIRTLNLPKNSNGSPVEKEDV